MGHDISRMKGRVIRGDALEEISKIPTGSVGAIITDVPDLPVTYSVALGFEFRRLLRPGGALVIMCDLRHLVSWAIAADAADLTWMAELEVLWDRTTRSASRNFAAMNSHILWFSIPGGRYAWNRKSINSNVLVATRIPIDGRVHPAQKPIELTNFIVSLLTRPTDLVLDPFCGSGSTLVSAELCGRDWMGIDSDADCCRIARRRVAHAEIQDEGTLYVWRGGKVYKV